MAIDFSVSSITFSAGQSFEFTDNAIVIIVGPNNAGKSTTLRGIQSYIQRRDGSPVLSSCEISTSGSNDDLEAWLHEYFVGQTNPGEPVHILSSSGNFPKDRIIREWNDGAPQTLQHSSGLFTQHANGAQLQSAATNSGHFDALKQGPQTPVQQMYADEDFEGKVSAYFRRAFGQGIFVNRTAGSNIPLHVGERPVLSVGEREHSRSYLEKLRNIPQIDQQGDGMKSFAGAILTVASSATPLLCLDEPELFLHPPQARELGRFIASDAPTNKQIFVATHNASLIRGLLAGNSGRISILRLTRTEEGNSAHLLDSDDLSQFWSDPILRYSDAIDGIFHERVIICESDSDCHFYGAMMSALSEQRGDPEPSVMFSPTGGKHRIKTLARSLRSLSVPTSVVVDLDVLNNEITLREIVESLGQDWEDLRALYSGVKRSIEQISPPQNANQVKDQILRILSEHNETLFDADIEKQVREAMRTTSPWRLAKRTGIHHLRGQAITDAKELIQKLSERGVFVLDHGEIERFLPSISLHGPKWTSAALERDLAQDPELQSAREFVGRLVFGF